MFIAFRERRRGRERERERDLSESENTDRLPPVSALTGVEQHPRHVP